MNYPIKKLLIRGNEVTVPHIRKKIRYSEGVEHVLTQDDVYKDKAFILATLAEKFYGDPNLYYIILDNNPPILDYFLDIGYKIFIPSLV